MSVRERISKNLATWLVRSVGIPLSDPQVIDVFGARPLASGVSVNETSAMKYSAVYAAVRLISETIASLPCFVYERIESGGKTRAPKHQMFRILHDKPNTEQDSFKFWEQAMVGLLLWGNAYAEIQFDGAGRPVALWPLLPDRTRAIRAPDGSGELEYETRLPEGKLVRLPSYRILHIAGLGYDGITGKSPIQMTKEAIGLGLATEQFGATFFGNGAKPGGVIEYPGKMSETGRKNLRESWELMHKGLDKQHRVAILEEGAKYQALAIPPNDAQFLETRKFQVAEIARIFRVPPHMLADLDRATWGNVEQESISFVVNTIRPWLVRIEKALGFKLFEDPKYFAEFLVDGLLRGDTKSRYEAYAIGRQWGWLSADDVRALENMNPLPNKQGQQYLTPLNMIPAVEKPQTKRSAGELEGGEET